MAAPKGYILNQKDRDALARAVSYVDRQSQNYGAGNGGGSGGSVNGIWLQIVDSDGAPSENTYVVDVYPSPYSTNRIAINRTAWNLWEKGNGASAGCGYAITDDTSGTAPCGSITGLEVIAPGRRFPALWLGTRNDTFTSHTDLIGYVFSERLDPIVKGTS